MVDDGFTSLQFTIQSDGCSFNWCNTNTPILVDDMSMVLENTKSNEATVNYL